MSSRHTNKFDVVDALHRFGGLHRGDSGATRHAMPALFKRVSDPHGLHHAGSTRSITFMSESKDESWSERTVVVTGGAGFLGRVVVAKLRSRGAIVIVPRSAQYDLTQPNAAEQLLADHPEAAERQVVRWLGARSDYLKA